MQDTSSAKQGRGRLPNGAEAWLRDPESKLCGRADFVASSEIVDFKTGERQDYHVDQMLFYAALHLAATGKSPRALRLVYTAGIGAVDVGVPESDFLRKSLNAIRQRAAAAEKQVIEGDLPAKPEPLKCAACHARGLCTKYWESLRVWEETENAARSPIVDYAPSAASSIETVAHGAYIRDSFAGTPSCLYLPQDVVVKTSECTRRVRVLSVRPTMGNGFVRLAYTQYSEIYISEQPGA